MVTVEQLYKKFGVLADAKDKAGEHEEDFLYIISAVKGGPGEKRLASQFVTRFFKYFPKLAYQAINALFDLCEDEDINIRKQAIKDLPALCKVNAEHVPKIAEALTQLLQCDDPIELSLIHAALNHLFTINAKSVLNGIFTQVHGDDDRVRDNAIKFLFINLRKLPEESLNKESQDYIVDECKKVLHDVTKEEFIFIMEILKSLSSMNTVMGRQLLLEIVTEQAELDQTFQVSDTDVVDRLMSCIKQTAPLFSKNVHSKVFVNHICNNVLPGLSELASPDEGVDYKLDMLKLLAEISDNNGYTTEEAQSPLSNVFSRLIEYMPLPPAEVESDAVDDEPKLQFSYVECLMYTFHQIGRKYPEFLTTEDAVEKLKDFRLRLQYFARGVQIYIKQLRQDLQGKTGDALKSDESKLKVCALKVTSNINSLIKDLFHNPPAYKCLITLSWRPATKFVLSPGGAATQATQKRYTPITFEGAAANGASNPKKTNREPRQLYAPPSGKFSEKAGNYTLGQRGGGRGGGRGRGFRGGRGWRY